MFSEDLFLENTIDKIDPGLVFELLRMQNLYVDVVVRDSVFFLYVSDMLGSYGSKSGPKGLELLMSTLLARG